MNYIQVDSIQKLTEEIAAHVYKCYIKSIRKHGVFALVLSGGNTPAFVFSELVKKYATKIDWRKVHIFWLDERCVSPEDKDSNYKLAKDHLLDYLEVGSIHRMQGELNPEDAAKAYEKVIKEFFNLKEGEIPSFDLILLGMGEDGHCASLFPESDELNKKRQLVISTKKQYNGHKRITMTLPTINKSNKILMIGSQKKLNVFNDAERVLPIHLVNYENMKVIVKI